MEFKTLNIFKVIAQEGSISKAANKLYCVQSNVSARVQKLEESLGTSLFIREARGMRLTPAGKMLMSYAQRLFNLREEAIQAVTSTALGKGLLRLGTMESTLAIHLPVILQQFTSTYTDIDLDISTGTTDMLLEAVMNYQIDGAFIGGEVHSPLLTCLPVFFEEIVLIVPKNINRIEEALFKKLVVFRQGCAYRAFAEQWLREQGLPPVRITELGTLDGIFSCISAGIGITCLPRSVAEGHHLKDQVRIHEIKDERAHVKINMIMNAESEPHPSLSLLISLIQSSRLQN